MTLHVALAIASFAVRIAKTVLVALEKIKNKI
jgi:hypothetical protein